MEQAALVVSIVRLQAAINLDPVRSRVREIGALAPGESKKA